MRVSESYRIINHKWHDYVEKYTDHKLNKLEKGKHYQGFLTYKQNNPLDSDEQGSSEGESEPLVVSTDDDIVNEIDQLSNTEQVKSDQIINEESNKEVLSDPNHSMWNKVDQFIDQLSNNEGEIEEGESEIGKNETNQVYMTPDTQDDKSESYTNNEASSSSEEEQTSELGSKRHTTNNTNKKR